MLTVVIKVVMHRCA